MITESITHTLMLSTGTNALDASIALLASFLACVCFFLGYVLGVKWMWC